MKLTTLLFAVFFSISLYSQTQIDFFTNRGEFRVEVREDLMPITAGNFISLVDTGFYDGLIFHRVVRGFVIQGGDPLGTGFGGPGYTIDDEYHPSMNHDSAGVISMAKTSAPNSAGSQFFFTLDATPHLDGGYAAFGSCIQGLDVIMSIGNVLVDDDDRPAFDVVMDSLRIVREVTGVRHPEMSVRNEVFPNPFRDVTQIRYEVKTSGYVSLSIFDMQGRLIQTLVDKEKSPGIHQIEWDGSGAHQAGMFQLVIQSEDGVGTRRLVKLK